MVEIPGDKLVRSGRSLGEEAVAADGAGGSSRQLGHTIGVALFGRRLLSDIFAANQIRYPLQVQVPPPRFTVSKTVFDWESIG